jgi:transcriptional regulator with XRE-family HTH domain
VPGQPISFGAELRRLRTAAGLSLTGLAGLVHYSKGYLSKIETGHQRPHPDLARRCDAVLDAAGTLTALVPMRPGSTSSTLDNAEWQRCGGSAERSSWRKPPKITILPAPR